MSDFCGPWSETDIITKSHHLAGVSWEAGINWSLSPAKEGRQQAIGWRCARATHSGSTSLYPGLINSIEIPRPPLTVFPIAQVLASYWSDLWGHPSSCQLTTILFGQQRYHPRADWGASLLLLYETDMLAYPGQPWCWQWQGQWWWRWWWW